MFSKIKEIIKRHNEQRKHNAIKEALQRSNELYQVMEHNGDLWFVFAGRLVCKMSFFAEKESVVDVLSKMRTDYVSSIVK